MLLRRHPLLQHVGGCRPKHRISPTKLSPQATGRPVDTCLVFEILPLRIWSAKTTGLATVLRNNSSAAIILSQLTFTTAFILRSDSSALSTKRYLLFLKDTFKFNYSTICGKVKQKEVCPRPTHHQHAQHKTITHKAGET